MFRMWFPFRERDLLSNLVILAFRRILRYEFLGKDIVTHRNFSFESQKVFFFKTKKQKKIRKTSTLYFLRSSFPYLVIFLLIYFFFFTDLICLFLISFVFLWNATNHRWASIPKPLHFLGQTMLLANVSEQTSMMT